MVAVLILHYLIGIKRHGFHPCGEWISFKETDGGKAFWPAFQEGVMKPLIEGFQKDRESLVRNLRERLGGRMVEGGDVAVEVTAFPEIFVRVILWEGDEDLPAEGTMLFDRRLNGVYCMEDVSALPRRGSIIEAPTSCRAGCERSLHLSGSFPPLPAHRPQPRQPRFDPGIARPPASPALFC
jgi:hypothetical protein